MTRKILTQYWAKPIPTSEFDVIAWYDGDEEDGPRGYGSTEDQAIKDLIESYPDETP